MNTQVARNYLSLPGEDAATYLQRMDVLLAQASTPATRRNLNTAKILGTLWKDLPLAESPFDRELPEVTTWPKTMQGVVDALTQALHAAETMRDPANLEETRRILRDHLQGLASDAQALSNAVGIVRSRPISYTLISTDQMREIQQKKVKTASEHTDNTLSHLLAEGQTSLSEETIDTLASLLDKNRDLTAEMKRDQNRRQREQKKKER
jgi:hypothetical protein